MTTRCTVQTRSSSSAASTTESARTFGCSRSSLAGELSPPPPLAGGGRGEGATASPPPPPPAPFPRGEGASTSAPRLRIIGLQSPLAGPFDLELAAGECLAITGASGSGKSLCLRMIADLDGNEGDVLLDGASRRSFSAPAWRRQVVYNAAEPGWWHERVGDHLDRKS